MITAEIKAKAQHYDGTVPDNWRFLGMTHTDECFLRFYEAPNGKIFRTSQKKKKQWAPKIESREEDGYTFANRNFKEMQRIC